MLKKIIAITMAICLIFTLSGCALKDAIRGTTANIAVNNAEKRLIKYLEEKYPDKTFTVEERDSFPQSFGETSWQEWKSATDKPEELGRCFMSFWDLIDENGHTYQALVINAEWMTELVFEQQKEHFKDQTYASDIWDNVQAEEIADALEEELYKTFDVTESENNFFVCTDELFEYSNTKFNGNIIEFLENHNLLAYNKGPLVATYFYNEDRLSVTDNLDAESYTFLKHTALEFVKYKENMPTKEKVVQKQCKTDTITANRQLMYLSEMKYIDKVQHIDGSKIEQDKPEEWVTGDPVYMVEIDNIFYFTNEETTEECVGEEVTDLTDWNATIQEYQKENDVILAECTPITKAYSQINATYCYIDKSELSDDAQYYLFRKDSKDRMGIVSLNDVATINEFSNLVWLNGGKTDEGIIIGSNWTNDYAWFVVECK